MRNLIKSILKVFKLTANLFFLLEVILGIDFNRNSRIHTSRSVKISSKAIIARINSLKDLCNFGFISDVLSVMPFLLSSQSEHISELSLRILRGFKLARVVKMARHNESLRLVGIGCSVGRVYRFAFTGYIVLCYISALFQVYKEQVLH